MKRLFLILTVSVLLIQFVKANDAILNGKGSTLLPTTETDIEIIKEDLTLIHSSYGLKVNVYFEFFNPGEAKSLTVGFITPPLYSPEVSPEDDIYNRVPDIREFIVIANGFKQPYDRVILDETEFDFLKTKRKGETFIYYFTMHFKKGLNTIYHHYEYSGNRYSMGGASYDYILTSGTYWGNKQIDDFSLKIDMGPHSLFGISFDENYIDKFKIVGSGRQDSSSYFIRDGYLELKVKNFKPTKELTIGIGSSKFGDYSSYDSDYYKMNFADEETLRKLSKKELRLLRNNFFAEKCYKFNDSELLTYYSQFFWYLPYENLSSTEVFNSFDDRTKDRIELIKRIEDEKD